MTYWADLDDLRVLWPRGGHRVVGEGTWGWMVRVGGRKARGMRADWEDGKSGNEKNGSRADLPYSSDRFSSITGGNRGGSRASDAGSQPPSSPASTPEHKTKNSCTLLGCSYFLSCIQERLGEHPATPDDAAGGRGHAACTVIVQTARQRHIPPFQRQRWNRGRCCPVPSGF